jgi:hypothetical protein
MFDLSRKAVGRIKSVYDDPVERAACSPRQASPCSLVVFRKHHVVVGIEQEETPFDIHDAYR